jgi:hypothetical protein
LVTAKLVRREYAGLLERLKEETSSGQINAIWRGTEHVLQKWEDEEIPTKGNNVPSLAALVSETESELEDRIAKRDLQALLKAKQRRKARPSKGPSLPRAPSPTPAA